MLSVLDEFALRRWAVRGLHRLIGQKDQLNAINVFPIADADTGANLCATMRGALLGPAPGAASSLSDRMHHFARGALQCARGSSGVILSQYLLGWAQACADHTVLSAADVRRGLDRGAQLATLAVAKPQVGTILTVAQAAADGAQSAELVPVLAQAAAAARAALAQTVTQIPVLAAHGVVDAGGLGLVILLEELLAVASGQPERCPRRHTSSPQSPRNITAGPQYELHLVVPRLNEQSRKDLAMLGEEIVIAGYPGCWAVHVHTDDPPAILDWADHHGGADHLRQERIWGPR